MGLQGDAGSGRVYVDCTTCKRSSRYTVASLIDRYEADISTLDLLRHLTASFRYQRAPGRRTRGSTSTYAWPRSRCRSPPSRSRPCHRACPTRSRSSERMAATSTCTSRRHTRCRWPRLRSIQRAWNGLRTRSPCKIGRGSSRGGSGRRGAPPGDVPAQLAYREAVSPPSSPRRSLEARRRGGPSAVAARGRSAPAEGPQARRPDGRG